MENEALLYLGETRGRPPARVFGIRPRDRLSHMYLVGKTGVGKSTLLASLALQDIAAGRGCAVIAPHGDLAGAIAGSVRDREIVFLRAADPTQPFGYNPLRRVRDDKIALAASGLL